MPRIPVLALVLLAALGGCHRKSKHPPAAPAPTTPSLSISTKKVELSDTVKATQFVVQGRRCAVVEAALLHITATQTSELTRHTAKEMPETFEGSLWLVAQKGEPFGKRDATFYSLGESLPAASKASSSEAPLVFQGPYTVASEHVQTASSHEAKREYVIYARCMSKGTAGHSFGSGDLDTLKKHAAETKDEILAVTIRWEDK